MNLTRNLFSCVFIPSILFLSPSFVVAAEPREVFVKLSSDSENAGYEAWRAMDGDPDTMWHTQFNRPADAARIEAHPIHCGYGYACGYDHHWQSAHLEQPRQTGPWKETRPGNNMPCPHELRIDLGEEYEIEGFIYTPRKGRGNGTIRDYEFYAVKDENAAASEPVCRGVFEGDETSYRVQWPEPIACRYLKLTAISEVTEAAFASVAELELLCKGRRFTAVNDAVSALSGRNIPRMPNTPDDSAMQERVDEWNLLAERFKTPQYWKAIENEVYDKSSLILPEDRDPLDVVCRRLNALLNTELDRQLPDRHGGFVANTRQDSIPVSDTEKRFEAFLDICDLRGEMLRLAEARLAEDSSREILFVKRHRSTYQHMCDQFYGRTQRPGGGLFVLNVETGDTRNLLENSVVQNGRLKGQKLEGGSFLSPDVSFDGKKIAFAYVECAGPTDHYFHHDNSRGKWDAGRCYHIFTCNADGGDLRQITDGTWNDFDPCWMPSGRIAFISERRNGYLRCGRECPTYTLFDMNADGSKIRCLSYHETNEWNPSVTHEGKILYIRWDYVDRYGCIVHHPWLTTPDGRDPRQIHGNYSHRHRRADAELDCRAIPGSPKYVATGGPHHGQSFGSLIIIDPRVEDDDAMSPVKRITPDVGFPESQGGGEVYGTPWALDEKHFLCVADFSFQPGAKIPGKRSRGNDGIYFCDVYGNRELLYRDPEIACLSPMPLAPRALPPTVPEIIRHEDIEEQPYVDLRGDDVKHGTMSLVNVYDSLRPFPEGAQIKELRIIQLLPMTTPSHSIRDTRTGIQEASSLDSVNIARCVLGTVPVEDDGSAHFELPAQIEFQFQALDSKGRAVQSMRSSSYLQPGENLSCGGCHEPKTNAPLRITSLPKALRREASPIQPENAPGARPFSYPLLVQPILDKHCVDCHAQAESKTFSLAKEPVRDRFYESYNNLAPKFGFTDYGDPLRTTPGKFGALASPLYQMLEKGHYDVKLSDEEMHRIILWLDCVSNFYGVYETEGQEAQRRGEVVWPTLE